ncbi:MAG: hypothetical protein RBG13Loki_0705 [Promethearchaeota archaeon CR_4]|nr:MAG: hypothetical protein RBG13Loki_0705 [Candidatus Lokiarchaeota archaeon CR_4]
MHMTSDPLKEIFSQGQQFVFLAGAGTSMDSPAKIPSALEIIKLMLESYAPAQEIEGLIANPHLRYELAIEWIQRYFDRDLTFLDYFDTAILPNSNHFFLAQALMEGHFVVTTNFDFLIERALLSILPPEKKNAIIPIITKEDYLDPANQKPEELRDAGKYPFFKIHGSKKDIIKNRDTSTSLVSTLSALGREREGEETFSIESYKKPVIFNLLKQKTLVVIGYSGSDDFDIGPLLRNLNALHRLVWVEHASTPEIEISPIQERLDGKQASSSKTDQLLSECANKRKFDVFKIKGNTAKILESIMWGNIAKEAHRRSMMMLMAKGIHKPASFRPWWTINVKLPPNIKRLMFATRLYFALNDMKNAKKCAEKGLALINIEKRNIALEFNLGEFNTILGQIATVEGDYESAKKYFEKTIRLYENTEKTDELGIIYYLNADLSIESGFWDMGFKDIKKALELFGKTGNVAGKAACLLRIGETFLKKENFPSAEESFNQSLEQASVAGDLALKARIFINLGYVAQNLKDSKKMEHYVEDASRIAQELDDVALIAEALVLKGIFLTLLGKYDEAEQVLMFADQVQARISTVAISIKIKLALGDTYVQKGEIVKALKQYQAAETLHKNSNLKVGSHKVGGISIFTKLAEFYLKINQFGGAMKYYEELYNFTKDFGDKFLHGATGKKIGDLYKQMGATNGAISYYQQALTDIQSAMRDHHQYVGPNVPNPKLEQLTREIQQELTNLNVQPTIK